MKETNQSNNYQPQHQPKDFQLRMDNNPAWLEKLSDSKSNIKQDARKRG